MAKMTREELARRRRINLYKKIIVYGIAAMVMLPILTSAVLLYKVSKLEQRLDYVLSAEGGDYLTYRSSRDALLNNSNADGTYFADVVKPVLGNTKAGTGQELNTAEDEYLRKLNENAAEKNTESSEGGQGNAEVDNEALEEDALDGESLDDGEAKSDALENGKSNDDPSGGKGTENQAQDAESENKKVKRVYLTFDDGPSIYTGQILDILNANNVKATFFVIGRSEEYYGYYKRIVDEGHTLGMHSFTHEYQKLYASTESFGAEVEQLQSLLKDVTGVESHIFRFPGGSSNNVSQLPIENYIAYLNERGINYYDWNALSGDAVNASLSPEQLVDNIMKDVRNNKDSVVLMHDLQNVHATVESLQMLIDTLKSEGYEILPIDENAPLIQHVSCNSVDE